VSYYDIDGDGSISLVEFTKFLLSRSSANKNDWMSIDTLVRPNTARVGGARKERAAERDAASDGDANSVIDEEPTEDALQQSSKVFLQNLRSALTKTVMKMRRDKQIALNDRLAQTSDQLYESQARSILMAAFSPYLKGSQKSIDFNGFVRALQKFSYPGVEAPSEDLYRFIFALCCDSSADDISTARANPSRLVEMMFERPRVEVNKFGFTRDRKPLVDTSRPSVGRGPLVIPGRTEKKLELSDVPHSFVTRKCRTALATPSNFDMRMMDRSSRPPSYDLVRQHVFGVNCGLSSGPLMHSIRSPSGGRTSGTALVYSAAAVGVVHDVAVNRQYFFDGHTDDITCVALGPADSGLVATGQTGKGAFVAVWDSSFCSSSGASAGNHPFSILNDSGLVAVIGKGFFQRGVCAACFSFDASFLCAIGCDDAHSMGIWDISSGALIASAPCHNGVPPQIRSLVWAPAQLLTGFISKECRGLCDVIATAGERHLKLWAFSRPGSEQARDGEQSQALVNKAAIMGKVVLH
jgi:WD40 repeat protein